MHFHSRFLLIFLVRSTVFRFTQNFFSYKALSQVIYIKASDEQLIVFEFPLSWFFSWSPHDLSLIKVKIWPTSRIIHIAIKHSFSIHVSHLKFFQSNQNIIYFHFSDPILQFWAILFENKDIDYFSLNTLHFPLLSTFFPPLNPNLISNFSKLKYICLFQISMLNESSSLQRDDLFLKYYFVPVLRNKLTN